MSGQLVNKQKSAVFFSDDITAVMLISSRLYRFPQKLLGRNIWDCQQRRGR
jgi:hypothetical protein